MTKCHTPLLKDLSGVYLARKSNFAVRNRSFSKVVAENSNKTKLKTYPSTRKNTFTLESLQSFSISGVISAEKM